MAQIYRTDITLQNCWKCDHFRRNTDSLANPNFGSCTAVAPCARGAVSETDNQDDVNAQIVEPATTVCGDFKPFIGPAREIEPVIE